MNIYYFKEGYSLKYYFFYSDGGYVYFMGNCGNFNAVGTLEFKNLNVFLALSLSFVISAQGNYRIFTEHCSVNSKLIKPMRKEKFGEHIENDILWKLVRERKAGFYRV